MSSNDKYENLTENKGIETAQSDSTIPTLISKEKDAVNGILEGKSGISESLPGSFWLQDDFSVILGGLNKTLGIFGKNHEWKFGISDYDFNIAYLPGKLDLRKLLDSDQELQNIIVETGADKIMLEHYMVKLRIREIIIQKLLPFVASLPKVYYDNNIGKYLIKDTNSEYYSLGQTNKEENIIAAKNIRNLVEFIILLTKGQGHKLFGLRESDFLNGSTLKTALNKNEYRNGEQMYFDLRGNELINLVQDVFANDKKKNYDLYKAQKLKNQK